MTTAAQRPGLSRALHPTPCQTNPEMTMTEIEDQAVQILSNEGAQCGNCGDQPGDRNCPDCENCRRGYVAALIAAGWAPREQPATPSAPAEQDLRDRIAQAIHRSVFPSSSWDRQPVAICEQYLAAADAVLAVLPVPADQTREIEWLLDLNKHLARAFCRLPEPVDRAAVLREVADDCDEAGSAYTAQALNDHAGAAFTLMERFLRKANEAEYVATPCSPGGREPGGEPCSTHERLMAHAEGDHELCEPDCGTSDGELRRMADEAQQAEPETVSGYFVYTDADAAHLSIGAKDDGRRPVVSVVADEAQRAAVVYVLPEDIEDVVEALREARRNAQALHDEAQQAGEGR